MTKPSNPPAFPFVDWCNGSKGVVQEGMTLRDWFAGQALVGILTAWKMTGTCENYVGSCQQVAALAYANADAMLAEREKPNA